MRTNKRVTAIIIRNDQMLLVRRNKMGNEYWVVIGGGVEDDETLEVALRREVREETGLELIGFQLVGENPAEIHGRQERHYFYLCQAGDGEPVLGGPELEANCPENHYELQWIEIGAVSGLKSVYPRFDYSKIPSMLTS